MEGPSRTVHCEDAVAWLRARAALAGCSLVTSLPDVSETPGLALAAWKEWFVECAGLALGATPPEGVAIFYQTDVLHGGAWVDKGYLCAKAAERAGFETLWHRVVCRRPPGSVARGRRAYSHMLCFGRAARPAGVGLAPDVLPDAGPAPWSRGMGLAACEAACRYVLDATPTRTVVDPFCGRGTALAVANALGLDAVGVELNRRRARQARSLRVRVGEGGALEMVAGRGASGHPED